VEALPGGLGVSEIIKALESDNPDDLNIAVDAQSYQVCLRNFHEKCYKEDMVTPFEIPAYFDEDDPGTVEGPFTNILLNPTAVPFEIVKAWMRFLKKYAAPVELESASWAEEIIEKSMSNELRALVHDDIEELRPEERGGVTTYRIMVQHMIMQTQEIEDALVEWLREFDIRNYNGENVPTAIAHAKAVIRALGPKLPSNAARCLLDGFARASAPEFQQLCLTLSTTLRSNVLQNQTQIKMPLKRKCFDVLTDLGNLFIELRTRHKWVGSRHDGKAFRATRSPSDLAANAARRDKPYDQWVTDKTCHICGENGHLARGCPQGRNVDARNRNGRAPARRGDDVRADRQRDGARPARDDARPPRGDVHNNRGGERSRRPQREREVRRLRRAFNLAIETLANDASSSESEPDNALPRAHAAMASDGDESDASGSGMAVHAARVYASLKG